MVSTITELREAIEKADIIKKEITDTLLELDVLPSVTTQASLNDMLVDLYDRINKQGHLEFEILGKVDTLKFINWIAKDFTNYSSSVFINTIKKH